MFILVIDFGYGDLNVNGFTESAEVAGAWRDKNFYNDSIEFNAPFEAGGTIVEPNIPFEAERRLRHE